MTQLPLCHFAVDVNAIKHELCSLEANFREILDFLQVFLFSGLLCAPIVYLISICVLQMCLMVQCGDFLNMKCEMKEEEIRTGRAVIKNYNLQM